MMNREQTELHIEHLRESNKKLHSELKLIEEELESNNKSIFLYELYRELEWLRGNLDDIQKDRLRNTEYNYFMDSIYDILEGENTEVFDITVDEIDDIYPRVFNYMSDDFGGINWNVGLINDGSDFCHYSALDVFEATHIEISDNSVQELIDYIIGDTDKLTLILK